MLRATWFCVDRDERVSVSSFRSQTPTKRCSIAYYVGRYGSVVLENGIIGWIGVNLLEEKFTPIFVDWKHVENPLKDGPSIYYSNEINISSVLE